MGIRATPIVEAMLALVVMDHVLAHRAQCGDVVVEQPPIAAQAPRALIRPSRFGALRRVTNRFVEPHCNSSRPNGTSSQSGRSPERPRPHSVEIQDEPGTTTKELDMRKRWVIGAVVLVVAVGAGVAIKAGKGAAAMPASSAMAANTPPDKPDETVALDFTAAEATRPVRLALPQMVEFSGALVAPDTAMVRAKATGTLLALDVQEGQRVKAGQLLGRIDVSDLASHVAERSANLAAVRTTLVQAQRTHDSNVGLADQKFISPLALDNSKSQLDSAKAQVDAAQAALDSARIALRDASLVAPISGIVSRRWVVAGEKVSAEQQVVTIVDLRRLELAGTVGTQDVPRLSAGMPVTLRVEGVDKPIEGRLARIAPAAEAGTRAIGVAVQLQNPRETLRAGQYAVAQVQIGDATPRLTVPIGALSSASGQEYVWTVEGGKLLRRTVTTGRRDPVRDRAEVLGRPAGRRAGAGRALRQPARRREGARGGRGHRRHPQAAGARRGHAVDSRRPAMWMTRVAINNPVFATMVMVALCVLGLFSYQRLGVDRCPTSRSPSSSSACSIRARRPGPSRPRSPSRWRMA